SAADFVDHFLRRPEVGIALAVGTGAQIIDHDLAAFGTGELGDVTADAAASSGNNDHFAIERLHGRHRLLLQLCFWRRERRILVANPRAATGALAMRLTTPSPPPRHHDKVAERRRAMGPLAGFKIIEMAGIGPAPMCAMLLADLGATVLRIDRHQPSGLGLP